MPVASERKAIVHRAAYGAEAFARRRQNLPLLPSQLPIFHPGTHSAMKAATPATDGPCMARRTTLISLLFALLMSVSACSQRASNEFGSPESATYGALDALAHMRSDREAAWTFLDEPTRDALERRAKAAGDVGHEVEHPLDLVRVGHLPGRADIKRIERVRVTNAEAELILHTYLDEEFPLTLFRDGSRWTLSLVSE